MNEQSPLIIDSHEDLAWNMIALGRDYTRAVEETRRREQDSPVPGFNGDTLLGWPEYQRGRVAVVFGTLFAAPLRACKEEGREFCYADTEEAHRLYMRLLQAYHRLVDEHPAKFRLIFEEDGLDQVLEHWRAEPDPEAEHPVGITVLMEGAEGVRDPGELEEWYQQGVRLIGPAWAGTRFCGGTREPGPLTKEGYALLEGMVRFGFSLDLSHMDETAALQALDFYPGPVCASHANAAALLKGIESNRHLSDRLIEGILERDGVIGVVPLNSFLHPGWKHGDQREVVSLEHVFAHIDHICQMAGDALHVGIGTDFDGGFGVQSVPTGIDTIADMRKLVPILQERGYNEEDIAAILGSNWERHLRGVLEGGTR